MDKEQPTNPLDRVSANGFTFRERIRLLRLIGLIQAGQYDLDRRNPTEMRLRFLRWLRAHGKLES